MEPEVRTLKTVFGTLCRWGGVSGFLGLAFLSTDGCPQKEIPVVMISSGGGILFWAVSTGYPLWQRPRRLFFAIPATLLLMIVGFLGAMLCIWALAGGPLRHPSR